MPRTATLSLVRNTDRSASTVASSRTTSHTREASTAQSVLAATYCDTSSGTPRIDLEVALVASVPRTGWFDPVACLIVARASAVAGLVTKLVTVAPTVSAFEMAWAAKSRLPNALALT